MKKTILTIIAMAMLATMTAQTAHMKFMGRDIDGTSYEFSKYLVERGFKKVTDYDNTYEGVFAGQKCTVVYTCSAKSKMVYKVAVAFVGISESSASKIIDNLLKKYAKENVLTGGYENVRTNDDCIVIDTDDGQIQMCQFFYDEAEKRLFGIDDYWILFYYDRANNDANDEESFSDL